MTYRFSPKASDVFEQLMRIHGVDTGSPYEQEVLRLCDVYSEEAYQERRQFNIRARVSPVQPADVERSFTAVEASFVQYPDVALAKQRPGTPPAAQGYSVGYTYVGTGATRVIASGCFQHYAYRIAAALAASEKDTEIDEYYVADSNGNIVVSFSNDRSRVALAPATPVETDVEDAQIAATGISGHARYVHSLIPYSGITTLQLERYLPGGGLGPALDTLQRAGVIEWKEIGKVYRIGELPVGPPEPALANLTGPRALHIAAAKVYAAMRYGCAHTRYDIFARSVVNAQQLSHVLDALVQQGIVEQYSPRSLGAHGLYRIKQ